MWLSGRGDRHTQTRRGREVGAWVLLIREVGEDGVHTHAFHKPYSTAAEAKEAAQQWKDPPLK
jgi:hypothetical protein